MCDYNSGYKISKGGGGGPGKCLALKPHVPFYQRFPPPPPLYEVSREGGGF